MGFPYGVVAITGASTGIGRELAKQLAGQGVKVGLIARNAELLEKLSGEIGPGACAAPCDVGDFAAVQAAVAKIEGALGPIECMVANAGIGAPREALAFDAAVTEQIYRTNVLGMTHAFYAVLPGMIARKRGHLVGVSSLASYQGLPQDAGYAGSKAAQRIHLESLRLELRPTGVKVTTVCPGFVRTPLTDRNDFDMPFLMEVGPAARRIIKAIRRGCRITHFPWSLLALVRLGLATPRWIFDWFMAMQAKGMHKGRKQARSAEHKS
ncbi:MAG: SDR family NAD(P)-dependent oxidoreductase [Planctomycetes bacterium]|nr:SDR family NAD(P)-dependent oxidoreductase [Planctomycetota bacterium]MCW8136122.1 SDR family NAD(P)-dependent oxidoreductase [Planctomycetota bacterium]